MGSHSSFFRRCVTTCAISSLLFSQQAWAHTVSVGYESAGSGIVDFWFGSYHSGVNATEGSLQVTGPNAFSETTPFTLLVHTKPTGLIDGTTNFFSNGTTLIGDYSIAAGHTSGAIIVWQGVQITGLTPGTYTFTYIPIAMPSQTWAPIDSVILSSSVTLSAAIINGGAFVPQSNSASIGAATILDSISGNATGDMANAISALQAMSTADQHTALQHIAPETNTAIPQASTQTVSGALDSVSSRLDSIRTQGYSGGVADDMERGKEVEVADNGDLSGMLDPSARHTFWTKAFGVYGDQHSEDSFAGYTSKTGGAAFGADTMLANDWVVGGAFTYGLTKVYLNDFRSGDSDTIDTYQATAYTTHDFGRWYIEGMAAYAYQTFDTSRDTGLTGVAQGSFDGDQYASRVTAGMPLNLPHALTLTPKAGLEWNYLHEQGYTETGAGPLSMSIASQDDSQIRSMLGAELSTIAQAGDYTMRPAAFMAWRYNFRNSGLDSTATFTGGGGAFTTPGESLPRNSVDLGGSLGISKTKNFTLSMELDTEQASGYSTYAGQILGQWKF